MTPFKEQGAPYRSGDKIKFRDRNDFVHRGTAMSDPSYEEWMIVTSEPVWDDGKNGWVISTRTFSNSSKFGPASDHIAYGAIFFHEKDAGSVIFATAAAAITRSIYCSGPPVSGNPIGEIQYIPDGDRVHVTILWGATLGGQPEIVGVYNLLTRKWDRRHPVLAGLDLEEQVVRDIDANFRNGTFKAFTAARAAEFARGDIKRDSVEEAILGQLKEYGAQNEQQLGAEDDMQVMHALQNLVQLGLVEDRYAKHSLTQEGERVAGAILGGSYSATATRKASYSADPEDSPYSYINALVEEIEDLVRGKWRAIEISVGLLSALIPTASEKEIIQAVNRAIAKGTLKRTTPDGGLMGTFTANEATAANFSHGFGQAEARVLMALKKLGTATVMQLAAETGIDSATIIGVLMNGRDQGAKLSGGNGESNAWVWSGTASPYSLIGQLVDELDHLMNRGDYRGVAIGINDLSVELAIDIDTAREVVKRALDRGVLKISPHGNFMGAEASKGEGGRGHWQTSMTASAAIMQAAGEIMRSDDADLVRLKRWIMQHVRRNANTTIDTLLGYASRDLVERAVSELIAEGSLLIPEARGTLTPTLL